MQYANANPKILIVYYSRSGKTRSVARAIASASAADLEEIQELGGRAGLVGYLLSGFEGMFGRRSRIRPAVHDPAEYDVVIVGSPTWGASVASPVRSYLSENRAALSNVAFFVTMGGSGGNRALLQMQELAGKEPLASLALAVDLVRKPAVCIGDFLEKLLVAWENESRRADSGPGVALDHPGGLGAILSHAARRTT